MIFVATGGNGDICCHWGNGEICCHKRVMVKFVITGINTEICCLRG